MFVPGNSTRRLIDAQPRESLRAFNVSLIIMGHGHPPQLPMNAVTGAEGGLVEQAGVPSVAFVSSCIPVASPIAG